MNSEFLATQMADHARTFKSLTRVLSADQARWKPDSDSWSVLEVINHLYDEERQDFRVRLDCILHRPDQPWPPINPQGWVTERAYNQRDLSRSVGNFIRERRKSLVWLKGLQSPDWQASVMSPFGKFSAGDMLAAWAAHDLLHLRQLVELHWAYLLQSASPFKVNYAGDW
jgi:hypothetical protein